MGCGAKIVRYGIWGMLVWCGFCVCAVWVIGVCGVEVFWCGLGIIIFIYLNLYIFNFEWVNIDLFRGNMK